MTGNLLVTASFAWFLPDVAQEVPFVGGALAATSLVHVPVLVAAILMAPEGRLQRGRDVVTVALAVTAGASAVTGGFQVLVPLTGLAVLVAGSLLWMRNQPAVSATRNGISGVGDGHGARACRDPNDTSGRRERP